MDSFKFIRTTAKTLWLKETKRIRYINDNVNDAKECKWQMIIPDPDKHISIFCSIGEWGSNITDILSDNSIDNYDFTNKKHRKAIFRYYTRLLLVTSEILTDFQDLIIYFKSINGKGSKTRHSQARLLLTNKQLLFTTQQLMEYINHICKHKFSDGKRPFKYHLCNHHIDYDFGDSKSYTGNPKNISILDLNYKADSKIEVPSIIDILNQILYAYVKLDQILLDKKLDIRVKLKPFVKTI